MTNKLFTYILKKEVDSSPVFDLDGPYSRETLERNVGEVLEHEKVFGRTKKVVSRMIKDGIFCKVNSHGFSFYTINPLALEPSKPEMTYEEILDEVKACRSFFTKLRDYKIHYWLRSSDHQLRKFRENEPIFKRKEELYMKAEAGQKELSEMRTKFDVYIKKSAASAEHVSAQLKAVDDLLHELQVYVDLTHFISNASLIVRGNDVVQEVKIDDKELYELVFSLHRGNVIDVLSGIGNGLSQLLAKKEEVMKQIDTYMDEDVKKKIEAELREERQRARDEMRAELEKAQGIGPGQETIITSTKAVPVDFEAEDWLDVGRKLYKKGEHEAAVIAFDKHLESHPDSVIALNTKGWVLRELGRPEEALKAFDRAALKMEPEYAYTWMSKGFTLNKLERYEDALAAYDRILELGPDDKITWSYKGYALSELGRYEEALKAFDKALELDPEYVYVWYNKGSVLTKLERYEEASAAYDRVLELDPKDKFAWSMRGNALRDLYRFDDALKSYDKALELDPEYIVAKQNRKICLKKIEEAK